jgi:hypothetical protein
MTRRAAMLAALVLLASACAPTAGDQRRQIFADVPTTIDPQARYLFHMHGSIVEDLGPSARGKFGQYMYYPTVEALADRGFVVISEVRRPTEIWTYANKVAGQVAQLRAAGVPADHITVTGISKGGSIAGVAAGVVADPDVRFVIMAGCLRGLTALGRRPPQGRVLSLYDRADQDIGSCAHPFAAAPGLRFEETVFETGRGHALFYTPERVWVDRVVDWAMAP